jgi:hypothetical protein
MTNIDRKLKLPRELNSTAAGQHQAYYIKIIFAYEARANNLRIRNHSVIFEKFRPYT